MTRFFTRAISAVRGCRRTLAPFEIRIVYVTRQPGPVQGESCGKNCFLGSARRRLVSSEGCNFSDIKIAYENSRVIKVEPPLSELIDKTFRIMEFSDNKFSHMKFNLFKYLWIKINFFKYLCISYIF